MKKKIISLLFVSAVLLAFGSIWHKHRTLKNYLQFEDARTEEIDIEQEMHIVHVVDRPGMIAWIGDDSAVKQGINDARRDEDEAYAAIGGFAFPFTRDAKLIKCAQDLHSKRHESIYRLKMISADREGTEEIGKRFLSAYRAYTDQRTVCGLVEKGFSALDDSKANWQP